MEKIIVPFVMIVYLILIIILVINMRKRNKLIKFTFILFFVLMLFVINVYNETIVDNFLYYLLKYIYFPSFFAYSITIILSFLFLLYTIFNDQMAEKARIINYIFGSLLIVSYIIFLLLKIDVVLYNSLYTGDSLLCLRYATRTFTLWLIVLVIIKYYNYFLSKRWF